MAIIEHEPDVKRDPLDPPDPPDPGWDKTHGDERPEWMKNYDREIKEAVLRGMALLEEKYGPDWVDHINLNTLNLSEGASCVLGQVYREAAEISGYKKGRWDVDGYDYGLACVVPNEDAEKYGFCAPELPDEAWAATDDPDNWGPLQREWEEQIAVLRSIRD